MGTKTEKLVKQLADTHKRLRDSSSRSGMSAQDRALLERQIARLEGSVADLTAHLCEKGVAYIKKDGMFTMVVRQGMSQLVPGRGGGMAMYGIADGPHGGGVDCTILSIKTQSKHMVLTE